MKIGTIGAIAIVTSAVACTNASGEPIGKSTAALISSDASAAAGPSGSMSAYHLTASQSPINPALITQTQTAPFQGLSIGGGTAPSNGSASAASGSINVTHQTRGDQ